MLILKKIYRLSLFALIFISLISLFFGDWRLPFSIFIGGIVGIGNLGILVWSIRSLIGTEKTGTKMILLSLLKIFLIFFILAILSYFKLINFYGLLIGFTLVTIIIVKEGYITSKKEA